MDRKAREACTVKGTLKLQWNATGRLLCQVASVVLTLCDPMDCGSPGPSVHGTPQARTLEWVAMPSPGDLPDPGIKPETPAAPALQADSLLLSHQGSPNTIYQRAKVTFVSQRDEKDQ